MASQCPRCINRSRARNNINRDALNPWWQWSWVCILYLSFLFCFLVSILLGSPCPTNKSCYHIQLGERNSEKFTHLCSRSLAIMDLTFIISSVSRVQDVAICNFPKAWSWFMQAAWPVERMDHTEWERELTREPWYGPNVVTPSLLGPLK